MQSNKTVDLLHTLVVGNLQRYLQLLLNLNNFYLFLGFLQLGYPLVHLRKKDKNGVPNVDTAFNLKTYMGMFSLIILFLYLQIFY